MWPTDRPSGWPPGPFVQNHIKGCVRRLIFTQELGVGLNFQIPHFSFQKKGLSLQRFEPLVLNYPKLKLRQVSLFVCLFCFVKGAMVINQNSMLTFGHLGPPTSGHRQMRLTKQHLPNSPTQGVSIEYRLLSG